MFQIKSVDLHDISIFFCHEPSILHDDPFLREFMNEYCITYGSEVIFDWYEPQLNSSEKF